MVFQFQKAEKSQARLRMAAFGPAGAGKTMSALRIASGMVEIIGGRIALIDTERGSASLYADRFNFDVLELETADIDSYIGAIGAAGEAGYNALIIDSMSHGWQDLLMEVDKLASAKYKGNTWSAWSEGTPRQRKFIDALLRYPGHIIATMRSKTEWTSEKGSDGKTRPQRVGLAPEQGKGIEYEFSLLLELNPDHQAIVIKDRTGKYQDKIMEKPGEKFGHELIEWLNTGKPLPTADEIEALVQKFREAIAAAESDEAIKDLKADYGRNHTLTSDQKSELRACCIERHNALEAERAA